MDAVEKMTGACKGWRKKYPKLYAFFWGSPLYRKIMYSIRNRLSRNLKLEGLSGTAAFVRGADMLLSLWLYGCSYSEYRLYGFSGLKHRERQKFIGDCCRKKYYIRFNSMDEIDCFRNKNLAYQEFAPYYGRQASAFHITDGFERFCEIINRYGTAMVKPASASGGYGVAKVSANDPDEVRKCFDQLSTISAIKEAIIEEFVEQAPELKALHPSSLNTARIITVLDREGIAHILGAFFRVGRGGMVVDNGASGGILCKLNEDGTILRCLNKNGVEFTMHPDTNHQLVGFTIPKWNDAKNLALTLARQKPSIRFCGWDLALSDKGWIMVEGNEASEFIGIQIFGDGCRERIIRYI